MDFLFIKANILSKKPARKIPRGVLNKEVGGGGLGPHIKFGGKIWGKVRPSSPTNWKNLGSSVTTRRKSREKVPILGSYLKFRGQNLGYLSFIFWRQNLGLQQDFQRQNLGPSPPRPPNMEVPPGVKFAKKSRKSQLLRTNLDPN